MKNSSNDWKVIIPNEDIKPHAKFELIYPDGEKEIPVAEFDCPCKPQIDFLSKLLIHNAFDSRQ